MQSLKKTWFRDLSFVWKEVPKKSMKHGDICSKYLLSAHNGLGQCWILFKMYYAYLGLAWWCSNTVTSQHECSWFSLGTPASKSWRLIGDFVHMCECQSEWLFVLCVSSVMNWQPDQGVACLLSNVSWNRLQLPMTLIRISGYGKCMDGWMPKWQKCLLIMIMLVSGWALPPKTYGGFMSPITWLLDRNVWNIAKCF